MFSGAFQARLREAWTELHDNLGRSTLQALGVMLGVASVLGGFSISDSMRRRSDEVYMRLGGMDKLNVQPNSVQREGTPSALQNANLGLRAQDGHEGEDLDQKTVMAMSYRKMARARIRTEYADQERGVTGIGADFIPMEGYAISEGRAFSAEDLETGSAVAILGSEAAATFCPSGNPVGQVISLGGKPVTVVGIFEERVFRFREDQHNIFAWRNRIVAVPAVFVQRHLQGDAYRRVDRVVFKIPQLDAMQTFTTKLASLLRANHRLQDDFRLDDVAARIRKARSQGDTYNIIFLLSGILALVGGGIVNVNVQLAPLKERVREVGVKMAIGAYGLEVFKSFMPGALLLPVLGAGVGMGIGVAFSWVITWNLAVPLYMSPASFLWAFLLAAIFGFVFALYPAWKASRLSPMEALRYE